MRSSVRLLLPIASRASTHLVRRVSTDTLRAAPAATRPLREFGKRRSHLVDELKELQELAGGLRSVQLTRSLAALGIVAHRLSRVDFPTPFDFLSK